MSRFGPGVSSARADLRLIRDRPFWANTRMRTEREPVCGEVVAVRRSAWTRAKGCWRIVGAAGNEPATLSTAQTSWTWVRLGKARYESASATNTVYLLVQLPLPILLVAITVFPAWGRDSIGCRSQWRLLFTGDKGPFACRRFKRRLEVGLRRNRGSGYRHTAEPDQCPRTASHEEGARGSKDQELHYLHVASRAVAVRVTRSPSIVRGAFGSAQIEKHHCPAYLAISTRLPSGSRQ
jgi:hypothetical protein